MNISHLTQGKDGPGEPLLHLGSKSSFLLTRACSSPRKGNGYCGAGLREWFSRVQGMGTWSYNMGSSDMRSTKSMNTLKKRKSIYSEKWDSQSRIKDNLISKVPSQALYFLPKPYPISSNGSWFWNWTSKIMETKNKSKTQCLLFKYIGSKCQYLLIYMVRNTHFS